MRHGICSSILDSAAGLTVTLASRHAEASSLDAGGRICSDAPADVPYRWRLWMYQTGGAGGRTRPVALVDVPDRWRWWMYQTGGAGGCTRPVALVDVPDTGSWWTYMPRCSS